MSDDLNTSAEIEIQLKTDTIRQNLRDIEDIISTSDGADDATKRLAKGLRDLMDEAQNLTAGLDKQAASTTKYAAGFDQIIAKLEKFKALSKESAQTSVVAGSLNGSDTDQLSTLSTDELKQFIAVDDARGQNAVTVARQIVAAREKEAADSAKITADQGALYNDYLAKQTAGVEKQRATEDALYNDYLAKQEAGIARIESAELAKDQKLQESFAKYVAQQQAATDKAVSSDKAAVDKEVSARTDGYSKELKAALEADDKLAAERNAKRYATVPSASRNVADPAAVAAAQSGPGYQTATTSISDYSTALGKQIDTSNRAAAATRAQTNELPRLRYALYDVSNAFGIVGAAVLAGSVAPTAVAASYETSFAGVQRTLTTLKGTPTEVAGELAGLKSQLIDLTTTIPVSFDSISQIATMGNQLNIPEEKLADFTETVAKFSATTNVSVDASATAFGRLGELLNTDDYHGLADDISYLGTKAVATEAQIIGVSKEIAVSTTQANFGAGATIALATALASLGVAPEAARGSVSRLFSTIETAVRTGGTTLNDFAKVSGVSADQFAQQWAADPSTALKTFLTGLNTSAGGVQATLSGLGITAQRDTKTWGLAAQNVNVYADALNNLQNTGGFLDSSYAVVADTVNSKLTLLQNNIARVMNSIGENSSGPIKSLLDLLNDAVNGLAGLMSNPIASWSVAAVLGLTAIGGAALLAAAGFLRVAATAAAVRTATAESAAGTNIFGAAMQALTGRMVTNAEAGAAVIVANDGIAASSRAAAGAQGGLASTADGVATKSSKLTSILGKAGMIGAILGLAAAVPGIMELFKGWGNDMLGLTTDADGLTAKIKGLGDQASATASSDALKKLFNPDAGAQIGAAINGATGIGAFQTIFQPTPSVNPLQAYSNQQKTGVAPTGLGASSVNDVGTNVKALDAALAQFVSDGNLDAANAGLKAFMDGAKAAGLSTADASALLPSYATAIGATGTADLNAAAAKNQLTDDTQAQSDIFKQNIADTYEAANATATLVSSSGALGAEFGSNTADVAANSSQLQQVISDLYAQSDGADDAASKMQGLFDALVSGGFASAQQLSGLSSIISSLAGGNAVKATTFDMTAFNASLADTQQKAQAAGDSAADAAPKVRTLVDYANDLNTVFQRSSDIRFGPSEGLDKIASTWLTIGDTITKANDDIATSLAATNQKLLDYQATMAGLTSDKSITEYWLGIAQDYGDALRAGELQAKLIDINNQMGAAGTDLATAQADGAKTVADAQDKTNKTLDGNSAAAIANRAEVEGLVGSYQDYITKLAASGASQETLQAESVRLKAEFVSQATQAGYSTDAIQVYAAAFDDMGTAISNIPRDITVTANADPALQALAELESKAASLGGKTFDGPTIVSHATLTAVGPPLDESDVGITQRGLDLPGGNPQNLILIGKQLYKQGFSGGGYTGDGDARDVAGQVHGREFVFDAPATRNAGPENLAYAQEMLRHGRNPFGAGAGGSGGGPGAGGPVDLSMASIQAIANAMSTSFRVGDQVIAASAGRHNTNSTNLGA